MFFCKAINGSSARADVGAAVPAEALSGGAAGGRPHHVPAGHHGAVRVRPCAKNRHVRNVCLFGVPTEPGAHAALRLAGRLLRRAQVCQ